MSSSSGDFDFGPTATDAIPEPVSASLLAMGGVMLLGAMNRRRR